MLFFIKIKLFLFLAIFFSNQTFALADFKCDAIDENLSGMVCLLEDGSTLTVSTLLQLGKNYNAKR